jgi:hypothetical protein
MRRRYISMVVVVFALWGLGASGAQSGRTSGPVLFTPQDAEGLRLTEEEWTEPTRSREISVGPRIVFQMPQVREAAQGPMLETSTPMDLLVAFEARGAAVDMQSLRVQACRGPFCRSLTETLRPYIRETRVEAKNVQVPEGRFAIKIDITDLQGRKTSEAYRLEVRGR